MVIKKGRESATAPTSKVPGSGLPVLVPLQTSFLASFGELSVNG